MRVRSEVVPRLPESQRSSAFEVDPPECFAYAAVGAIKASGPPIRSTKRPSGDGRVMILIDLLWALSLLSVLAAIVIGRLRRRLPPLPDELLRGGDAPPVVLLKPVLRADAATLARCHAWIASAAAYPGRAAVVFSSVEPSAEALGKLACEHPSVEVRVCSCLPAQRQREPGLDKVHRLMAAEALSHEILTGRDGILLACDEDVEPLDPRCVERLAAAAPHPGTAVTVTNAPALAAAAPGRARVGAANMAFNNQIYTLFKI